MQPYNTGTGMYNQITMTLGDMVDGYSTGVFGDLNSKIEFARQRIFDFDYPYINEKEKKRFETNFIRYFFMHEIGQETEYAFKFKLETWLNLNLPYWNKLLESQLWESAIRNPLQNYDLSETITIDEIRDKLRNEDTGTESNKNENANKQKDQQGNTTNALTRSLEENTDDTINETLSNDRLIEEKTNSLAEKTLEDIQTESGSETASSESDVSGNTTQNDFNRVLKSNNPDERLSITPNPDGTGVIEYANEIEENKNTSTNNSTSNETVDASKTTSNNVEQRQDETTTISNTKDVTDGFTETKLGNNAQEKTALESQNSSVNSNENETETLLSNSNEKISEKTIESENEKVKTLQTTTKIGAIGVARYDELLNGYREIFKNYDKMILDAMHPYLFMLVY